MYYSHAFWDSGEKSLCGHTLLQRNPVPSTNHFFIMGASLSEDRIGAACETTHLLDTEVASGNSGVGLYQAHDQALDHDVCEEISERPLGTELQAIFNSSVPLVITFLLQYSLTVMAVFSAGNIGSQELGAVTLANLLANVTSYGVILGVASALSTLCPQAYGMGDLRLVGLHAARCFLLLMVLLIPIALLWLRGAYPLLLWAVGDPRTCLLAAQYLSVLLWGMPAFITFEVLKQYLQAQGIFHASTYVLFVCAPLNIVLNFVLVSEEYGIGFLGAPLAIVISNWTMAVLLLGYTLLVNGHQCWPGLSNQIFTGWWRLLTLAGPGVLIVEGEWLAFEIVSFASSKFGVEALAAQSIISTICFTVYQIPYAVSVASSTRIAWYIGSQSKHGARKAVRASFILAVSIGCFDALVLGLFKHRISTLFSKDPVVVDLASRVLIVGALYQISDAVSCVTAGILRGQGRQYIGGWLNVFGYYVLALPVAFVCAFHFELELLGLWLGMILALTFVALVETLVVIYTDWDAVLQSCLHDKTDNLSVVDTHSIY